MLNANTVLAQGVLYMLQQEQDIEVIEGSLDSGLTSPDIIAVEVQSDTEISSQLNKIFERFPHTPVLAIHSMAGWVKLYHPREITITDSEHLISTIRQAGDRKEGE